MGIDRREFQQRRQQVMEKIGHGTAIFRSAPMAVMHNDVEYTYRQDSDFFYLTGFNEPDAVAILAPHHPEHQFILFVQPKDQEKETWTGYLHGVEGAKYCECGSRLREYFKQVRSHLYCVSCKHF